LFHRHFKGSTFLLRQEVDTNTVSLVSNCWYKGSNFHCVSPLLAELHYLCTVKIWPLSTCLILNFSVSLPHWHGSAVSLETVNLNSSTHSHIRSCTMNQAYLQINIFNNVSQRRMLLRMINALANRSLTCHSSSFTNPCTITYNRRQRKSFNQLVTWNNNWCCNAIFMSSYFKDCTKLILCKSKLQWVSPVILILQFEFIGQYCWKIDHL